MCNRKPVSLPRLTIRFQIPAASSGIYSSRSVVPDIKPSFEVYCDNDDENNVIHQLEKQCQEERISQKPADKVIAVIIVLASFNLRFAA